MWSTTDLVGIEGHILDRRIIEQGGIFYLPLSVKNIRGQMINHVILPPQEPEKVQDRYVLPDLQLMFDRLIHFAYEWKEYSGDEPKWWDRQFEIHVRTYWNAIMDMLLGKRGLLDLNIYSLRVEGSFRGVICHCPWIQYDEIALPYNIWKKLDKMFNSMKEDKDDAEEAWGVLFRQPVLHGNSFRKVKLRSWEEETIGLAPPYTGDMNADYDGDWAFGFLGKPGLSCEEDWSSLYWDHEMLLGGGKTVDLENYEYDQEERIEVPCFGLSYKDVFEDTGVVDVLGDCASLNLDEIREWAEGQDQLSLRKRDSEVSMGIAMQKLWIGMIGNFAKMLWIMADDNETLAKSFGHVIERGSQKLFDSKHELSHEFMIILELLEGERYVRKTRELLEHVLDPELSAPFYDFMESLEYHEISLRKLVNNACPAYTATSRKMNSGRGLAGYFDKADVIDRLVKGKNCNKIVQQMTERLLHGENFISRFREKASHKTEGASRAD